MAGGSCLHILKAAYPDGFEEVVVATVLREVLKGLDDGFGSSANARESLELAFQMSNILAMGLDRHTLSILIDLCDRGLNPDALAALVRELRNESHSSE
ncbi:mitotic-spindle organizing protein 1B [Cinnamomum micranthum f. kanehirae]|uniref:Mitotic-spindle organizing protein 1B n=1 Tax=Cinnamomum micranthum f. kanehirae TaxID=337451 RepID=A0A3S3NTE8_9MAGN|nr:mitotic-spindle organizing protein 1B [Cinnamomum micranthum f. kanehirae]